MEDQRLFLAADAQHQTFSAQHAAVPDDEWELARQSTADQLERCKEQFHVEFLHLQAGALWLRTTATSKFGLTECQMAAKTSLVLEQIQDQRKTLVASRRDLQQPGRFEQTVVNLFDEQVADDSKTDDADAPQVHPCMEGSDQPIQRDALELLEDRSPSPEQHLEMQPAERPLQEDYHSLSHSLQSCQAQEALRRKSRAHRRKTSKSNASALKSPNPGARADLPKGTSPKPASSPRKRHQNSVQAAKKKPTHEAVAHRKAGKPKDQDRARDQKRTSPSNATPAARKAKVPRSPDDPILVALTAATKAALEKRGHGETMCQAASAADEQQAGTAERTRPQSRGNGADERHRTAPVTATPKRGTASKAKEGIQQKMSESTAGKKLAAAKSERSGPENLQQVPRYMRPLNRQVSALANQLESVRERVCSLRTSLRARAQKASLDSAPAQEAVVEPDL